MKTKGNLKRDRKSDKIAIAKSVNDRETVSSSVDQVEIGVQSTASTKGIPEIMKKLIVGLVIFLTTVLCLILIEAIFHHKGQGNTRSWFKLAEHYAVRYVLLSYLASAPTTYNIYRKYEPESVLKSFCSRTMVRINRVYKYNVITRGYLEDLDLHYDYQTLTVVNGATTFSVSFLYAMITVGLDLTE